MEMKDTDFFVPKKKIQQVAMVYAPGYSTDIKVIIKPDTGNICIRVKFYQAMADLFRLPQII